MSTEQPSHRAPIALWRIAADFLNAMYNLFGAPEQLAARGSLAANAYGLIAAWVHAGETLLRRLLLIEAAAWAPELRPIGPARASKPRQRKLMAFTHDQPDEWRVTFRCFAPSETRAHAHAKSAPRVPPQPGLLIGAAIAPGALRRRRFYSAWPLAERYEALIRVVNDPAPFARRLARRLAKHAALVARVLALPKPHQRQSGDPADAADMIGAARFAQIEHAARQAQCVFEDSS